jgi:nicotinic acid mononucleotide adenylyltransferase
MSAEPSLPAHYLFLLEAHEALEACRLSVHPTIRILSAGFAAAPGGAGPCAVLAASFNPPTEAHEAMVSWALGEAGFSHLLLLLDARHADKAMEDAVLEDRCLMMQLRFAGFSAVSLGVCSHGRFRDKAYALKGRFPGWEPWTFLMGKDALGRLLDPRFYDDPEGELRDLFAQARFVVFDRPGHPDGAEAVTGPSQAMRASVSWAKLPQAVTGVSSSEVRRRRREGLPLAPLVAPAVEQFIAQTGLYLVDPGRYAERKSRLCSLFRSRGAAPSGALP